MTVLREAGILMGNGKHGNNIDTNGYIADSYDHAKTKDVSESSGGKHSKDDKDDPEGRGK